MSAEMNNKYDAANFAKVLDEFSPQSEMQVVDQYLYGVSQTPRPQDKQDFKPDGDRSQTERSLTATQEDTV